MGDRAEAGSLRYSIFSVQDHYPGRRRSLTQFYDEMMGQAGLADSLGYDTFFIAEHHFHEYGVSPNPAVTLAAVAARTKRLRLGTAVSVLPLRNPITVAEDYALLDQLSHGRAVLGVGSGYLAHEFAGFGIDAAEKRERFDEALTILKKALGGERFSFTGKFHKIDNVAINVTPLQRPHPPIYVAVLRKEAAYFVGRQGHRLMNIPYASVDRFDEIALLIAEYKRGRSEAGLETRDEDMTIAFHTYVAESDEAARREAAEAFNLYVETRLYAKRQTYDDILRSGLALFGSVETVTEKLVKLHAAGLRHVMLLQNFGLIEHAKTCRSMARFAGEVMPRLMSRIGGKAD